MGLSRDLAPGLCLLLPVEQELGALPHTVPRTRLC